ncbi:hypothetical protein EXW34_30670 (plasmid) [Bacillus mycoides]|nr:hypothetical protein EXW34_30670 [Bacillus mycoides]
MSLFLFIYIITEVKQKKNSAELLYNNYILFLFNYHLLFCFLSLTPHLAHICYPSSLISFFIFLAFSF